MVAQGPSINKIIKNYNQLEKKRVLARRWPKEMPICVGLRREGLGQMEERVKVVDSISAIVMYMPFDQRAMIRVCGKATMGIMQKSPSQSGKVSGSSGWGRSHMSTSRNKELRSNRGVQSTFDYNLIYLFSVVYSLSL